MLRIATTNRFEKELQLAVQRGKDIAKIRTVMLRIADQQPLDVGHKDHLLVGNYVGRRECHIQPDWLLIYKIDGDRVVFERTGSHSDLFR